MKSGGSFFRIDIIYMIYLIMKYFSAVSFSIYCEKLAGTFLRKEVNSLSVRHNLKSGCVKTPVFGTYFKIFNSCVLYIQHVVTRNKPWSKTLKTRHLDSS